MIGRDQFRLRVAVCHRGPDGNGYYRDHRAALGHTRLAIIDTAGGAQPLANEDGSLWVTFTGRSSTTSSSARSCGGAATPSPRRATPR